MMRIGTCLRWSSALVALAACGGSEGGRVDAAVVDAAVVDAAAVDAAVVDAGWWMRCRSMPRTSMQRRSMRP
jgi:hypothetical protein